MTPSVAPSVDLWLLLEQAEAVPVGRAANDFDVAMAVSVGLPIVVLRRLLELRVLEVADVPLIMPMRTFKRREATRSRLTTDESDRVVRMVKLTVVACEALGGTERGTRWLRTPNAALRGFRPLDCGRTSIGALVVTQILGRINHGIGF
jgi:putative toxin-antitoxin system antitoxin component (TIGR02293 family)